MKLRRILAALLALLLLSMPALALNAEQAKRLLEEFYIDELPAAALEAETVEEVIAALGDIYTEYFTAEAYTDFLNSMRDTELVGVGIQWVMTEVGVYVHRVIKGSAAEGKLLAGDFIIAVDGESLMGQDIEDVSGWMQGEAGTKVTLAIFRDGGMQEFTLTRAQFTAPSTDFDLVDGHIGVYSCYAFGPETYTHFLEAMEEYDHVVDRWIVDLRGNTGGETQAASDALGIFLGETDTAYVRDGAGNYYRYGTWPDITTMDPVIVLVDEMTASASELFAGAVRARMGGILIGTRTYGKGISQVLLDGETHPEEFPDGDGLKITTYRNYTPDGSTPDVIGVLPHLPVDDAYITAAAMLLSSVMPDEENTEALRVHLGGWRWYIDLNLAAMEGYSEAFAALLDGLPAGTALYRHEGGLNWSEVTADEVGEWFFEEFIPQGRFLSAEDSVFRNEINELKKHGILRGNETGDFLPEKELTRAELCAMLAQGIGWTGEWDGTFSDVVSDAWYASAVSALARQGLVVGYDGRFSPDEAVSHEQMMVIFARVAARLNMYVYDAMNDPDFMAEANGEDYAAYSEWARELVYLGDGMYFDDAVNIDPSAPATRAEAAASLYRMLRNLGYL